MPETIEEIRERVINAQKNYGDNLSLLKKY